MVTILRKVFPHKSIYAKLFLLFFIIGVIPLIVGSFYAYSSSRKALLHAALKEQELEVNSGMRNIVILFVDSSNSLLIAAQNSAFVRYLEETQEKAIYKQEQEKALNQIVSLSPEVIESAGFADRDGRVISLVPQRDSMSSGKRDPDVSGEPFFRQTIAFQQGRVYYGLPLFSGTSRRWIIPEAIPVFNRRDKLLGVLYLKIYLDSITRFVRNVAHPIDLIVVVNQEGQLIVPANKEIGESLPPALLPGDDLSYQSALRHMMAGDSGDMSISYKGIPSYITYKKIPAASDNLNEWSIGIITPEETIYAEVSVRKYLFFDLSASIVLLTIAGVLGWRISRPIRQITSASMAMSHGDLASRVNLRSDDEIGQLADTFNEMAASIQASHEELTRLSSTDGLTGLYNHREFQKRLEEEISRASRYVSPLSLLMIDIDYFKKVNDTYGHPSGDAILRSIGTVILQEIRSSDLAARYGGEEITVILPEIGSSDAFTVSERVRKRIQEIPITILAGETIHVTVSVGVASFPGDAHDREGLIDTADQALYFAKEKGRNRTVLYGETIKSFLEKEPVKAETLMEQAEEWLFKDLAISVEARLPFRRGYFNAVTRTALQIARSLQFGNEEIQELKVASMLYEVGALNIPANILLKQGTLTQEEWGVVKKMPDLSVQILTRILKIRNVLPAIRHHHEHYDGTGYPSGLKGEEIPLMARIISVVDAYHAMTTATPYRRKMTHEEAMGVLKDNSGTQFDPNIVEVFIKNLEHKKDKAPDLETDTP